MKEKEKCMMCQFVIKKVNSGPYPRLSLYIYIWGPQKKKRKDVWKDKCFIRN